jgi:ketosteroid isomerase-like protein
MTAEENKEIVRKWIEEGVDAVHEDVKWTIPGSTRYSGTYNGKQDLVDRLFTPLMAELQGPGKLVIEVLVADGDYVVIQNHAVDRILKDGTPYNNWYCMVARLEDGKIVELVEHMDTALVDATFSR